MSDKKTLDEILELLQSLEERIKNLEKTPTDKWGYPPFPYREEETKTKKCPHCGGTGKVCDRNPWRGHPYFMG